MGAYVFDNGIRPSIGYVQSRANINGIGSEFVQKYLAVGVAYYLNKNFVVDAAYEINMIDEYLSKYDFNTDDTVILAATYQF